MLQQYCMFDAVLTSLMVCVMCGVAGVFLVLVVERCLFAGKDLLTLLPLDGNPVGLVRKAQAFSCCTCVPQPVR